ncbi:hypothetical protein IU479_17200 [Nocardia abscessus]|uniref:hypothetical protein n=1 Tax=Nocardia TaxID=1817 RepID=UPI001895C419|nr:MULTISPECIES: hypothetical protein [Nocardia]MBF6219844.1 hypothetical protein [Nocardia abscessus]MDE1668212.1 hypothetical protein [Nocardia gipuzkoensis]
MKRTAYELAIGFTAAIVAGTVAASTAGTAAAQPMRTKHGMTYKECMTTGKDSFRRMYHKEAVCVGDGYGYYKLEPAPGQ